MIHSIQSTKLLLQFDSTTTPPPHCREETKKMLLLKTTPAFAYVTVDKADA
jgi:hypothetical protein